MISDVHEQWHDLKIPECDILISAGDYSYLGKPAVVKSFHSWLSKQPAKHVISVQGNHEVWVERNLKEAKEIAEEACPGVNFIVEGALEIQGIKIYCSAVQPEFGGWAWNVPRGEKIKRHWDAIPDDTELLITHGPPYGILDQSDSLRDTQHLGCGELYERVQQLNKLKLHVFGHIHGGSDEFELTYDKSYGIANRTYVNASICDERYKPTNPVREFEW